MVDDTNIIAPLVESDNIFSEAALRLMPASCDRLLEARYFARNCALLDAVDRLLPEANWNTSACMPALIGIEDAGKSDFERAEKTPDDFRHSSLGREFNVHPEAVRGVDRDPVGAACAFRDLRNLRMHYAEPLVEVRWRVLEPEIAAARGAAVEGRPRWFLRPIAEEQLQLLRHRRLPPQAVAKFNRWIDTRSLAPCLYQSLCLMIHTINQTAKELAV